ncbi:hypothetical protein M569_03936, partial [Genlisea aurea]
MGVGGNFWDFLKPCARFEGFGFLRNKWVAVDLSYWIVQHETAVKGYYRNSHIRLAFFRTINLFSKFGAYPIFVLDGTPSPLKSKARALRYCRLSGIDASELAEAKEGVSVERNRAFNKCIEECELLEHLGMPVLKAKAEAEALCAELNSEGYVDACITSDSDAFLYGAKCVIKRIQPKSKDPFECYNISDIETVLGLKRNHLIAVSLLVGNDHDLSGVMGIGMETAVRFVKSFDDDKIFDRDVTLRSSTNSTVFFFSYEFFFFFAAGRSKASSPHCSHCGHPGKKADHRKFSCEHCKSVPGESCSQKSPGFKCHCSSCDTRGAAKEKRKDEARRIAVCRKISSHDNFPNEEILQMYLRRKHHRTTTDNDDDDDDDDDGEQACIEWSSPSTDKLLHYLSSHLQWKPSYTQRKLLPLLSTRYLRSSAAPRKTTTEELLLPPPFGKFEFDGIRRVKTTYGHSSFVVRWRAGAVGGCGEDDDGEFGGADSDEEDPASVYREEGGCLLVSEEDMELVEKAFPDEVQRFFKEMESKSKKKSKSKTTTPSPGYQSSITEYYYSSSKTMMMMMPPTKKEHGGVSSSSQSKRRISSGPISKSVRRRLLF